MKKFIVLIAALLAALLIVGCASKPAAPTGPTAADLIADAKSGASGVVAQATGSSQSAAEQNAVNNLKRGLKFVVGEQVDAQVKSGRLTSDLSVGIKQNMATALDRIPPSGAVKVGSGADGSGRGWAVYSIDQANALQLITSALNAIKDTVPVGNYTPSSGFDVQFTKAAAQEWK